MSCYLHPSTDISIAYLANINPKISLFVAKRRQHNKQTLEAQSLKGLTSGSFSPPRQGPFRKRRSPPRPCCKQAEISRASGTDHLL